MEGRLKNSPPLPGRGTVKNSRKNGHSISRFIGCYILLTLWNISTTEAQTEVPYSSTSSSLVNPVDILNSSSSNSSISQTNTASSVVNYDSIQASVQITSLDWLEGYSDRESAEFRTLATNLTEEIECVFRKSPVNESVLNIFIDNLSELGGFVVVDFTVRMRADNTISASEFQSLFLQLTDGGIKMGNFTINPDFVSFKAPTQSTTSSSTVFVQPTRPETTTVFVQPTRFDKTSDTISTPGPTGSVSIDLFQPYLPSYIGMEIVILLPWVEAYTNQTSAEFRDLSTNITSLLDNVFRNSSINESFDSIQITEFREKVYVIVDYDVLLTVTRNVTLRQIVDAFMAGTNGSRNLGEYELLRNETTFKAQTQSPPSSSTIFVQSTRLETTTIFVQPTRPETTTVFVQPTRPETTTVFVQPTRFDITSDTISTPGPTGSVSIDLFQPYLPSYIGMEIVILLPWVEAYANQTSAEFRDLSTNITSLVQLENCYSFWNLITVFEASSFRGT